MSPQSTFRDFSLSSEEVLVDVSLEMSSLRGIDVNSSCVNLSGAILNSESLAISSNDFSIPYDFLLFS